MSTYELSEFVYRELSEMLDHYESAFTEDAYYFITGRYIQRGDFVNSPSYAYRRAAEILHSHTLIRNARKERYGIIEDTDRLFDATLFIASLLPVLETLVELYDAVKLWYEEQDASGFLWILLPEAIERSIDVIVETAQGLSRLARHLLPEDGIIFSLAAIPQKIVNILKNKRNERAISLYQDITDAGFKIGSADELIKIIEVYDAIAAIEKKLPLFIRVYQDIKKIQNMTGTGLQVATTIYLQALKSMKKNAGTIIKMAENGKIYWKKNIIQTLRNTGVDGDLALGYKTQLELALKYAEIGNVKRVDFEYQRAGFDVDLLVSYANESADAIQLKTITSSDIPKIKEHYDDALKQLVGYTGEEQKSHRKVVYLDIQSTDVSDSIRDRHNTEGDQGVLKLLGISSNTETPHTLIIRLHKKPPKINPDEINPDEINPGKIEINIP
jgi:hypothetical protein